MMTIIIMLFAMTDTRVSTVQKLSMISYGTGPDKECCSITMMNDVDVDGDVVSCWWRRRVVAVTTVMLSIIPMPMTKMKMLKKKKGIS